jgi:hypothetical protein
MARVGDWLFNHIKDGTVLIIYVVRDERGYVMRTFDLTSHIPVDFDGLYLVAP